MKCLEARSARGALGLVLVFVGGACTATEEHAALSAAATEVAPTERADDLGARVDALCATWNSPGCPGCAVGVIRDGELVLARGYGMANLEHAIPIAPASVFDIGSTSKQFTAASVGLLVGDGRLSIDDDVRKWVPELPDYGATITLAHLLHHTSGLRDYLELFAFAGRKTEDWTTQQQALAMIARQKTLNFEPGSEHLYSNSGYFLLSLIVERASGMTLADFAMQRIFEPLEMHDTHIHDDHTLIVERRATAYAPREDGGFGIDMSDFEQTGDGAVMTTVADLAKWDSNFYTQRVGGQALQNFLHEHGRTNDGRELDYARGLVVDHFRGLDRVSHGGAWAGYRAQLVRFPKQRCSVICLCNLASMDPSAICAQIAGFLLEGEMNDAEEQASPRPRRLVPADAAQAAPTPTADELQAYAGIYESDELEVRAEVALRGTSLFVGEVGLADFELPPRARDSFGPPGATFEFVRDEAGAITGFRASTGRMRNLWFARVRRS